MVGNRGKRKEANDTYFELRARNNVAVKKSREKARHRNFELEKKFVINLVIDFSDRLETLRKENNQLKENLSIKFQELSLLKKLLHQVNIEPPPRLLSALALRHKQQNVNLFNQLPLSKCEQFGPHGNLNMVTVDLLKEGELQKIAKSHLSQVNMINMATDKALYSTKVIDRLPNISSQPVYRPSEIITCNSSGEVVTVNEQSHKMITRGQRTKQISDKREFY